MCLKNTPNSSRIPICLQPAFLLRSLLGGEGRRPGDLIQRAGGVVLGQVISEMVKGGQLERQDNHGVVS